MKYMLKQMVILMFLGSMSLVLSEAKPYSKVMDMKGNSITLQGRLSNTGSKGVNSMPNNPAPAPVTVEQNATNLTVSFLSSLGNLCITVTNAQGYPVYQKTVNAVNGTSHIVDTLGWSAGTYTIRISDALGGALMGGFQIP